MVPGTAGYGEDAASLIPRYEGVSCEEKYGAVLHLLPLTPCNVVDLGAGTGVDAAWFAAQGHSVLAVEPTAAFRESGGNLHPSQRIQWLNDSLPDLIVTKARNETFDLAVATAVWMHLDEDERGRAMANISDLLNPGASLIMSLRYGGAPSNRRIFAVKVEETIGLAQQNGLKMSLNQRRVSSLQLNREAGVDWSWLVFQK